MGKAGETTCYYRPIRSGVRRFSAKDVARVYCHALSQGVSREDIRDALAIKCELMDRECSCDELLDELNRAQAMAKLLLAVLAILPVIGVTMRTAINLAKKIKDEKNRRLFEEVLKETEKAAKNRKVAEDELKRLFEKEEEVVRRVTGGGEVIIKP